jgi:glutamate-1-semialdehyde aminotransferase
MAQRVALDGRRVCRSLRPSASPGRRASQELHREAREVLCGGVELPLQKVGAPSMCGRREARNSPTSAGTSTSTSSWASGVLGHSPEVVVTAVREVFGRGDEPRDRDCARSRAGLGDCAPRAEHGAHALRATGTEATMMALRAARAFTRRVKIGRSEGHYHGQHDAALVSVAHVAGPSEAPEPLPDGAGIPPGCSPKPSSSPGTTRQESSGSSTLTVATSPPLSSSRSPSRTSAATSPSKTSSRSYVT